MSKSNKIDFRNQKDWHFAQQQIFKIDKRVRGLGEIWECLGTPNKFFYQDLPYYLKEARRFIPNRENYLPFGNYINMPSIEMLTYPTGEGEFLFTIFKVNDKNILVENLPYIHRGTLFESEILEVNVWEDNPCDAEIVINPNGFEMTFFDILFPLNHNLYAGGVKYLFKILGFIQAMKLHSEKYIEIPSTNESKKIFQNNERTDSGNIKINVEKARLFLPLNEISYSRNIFLGSIKKIEEFKFWDKMFYYFEIDCLRNFENNFYDIGMIMLKEKWQEQKKLEVGDMVIGEVWLAGSMEKIL